MSDSAFSEVIIYLLPFKSIDEKVKAEIEAEKAKQ